MKLNSKLVWIATLALPLAVGCGGGSKEEAPSFDAGNAASTATPATTGTAAPAGAPAAAPAAATPAGGATVSGKVTLAGTAPAMETLKMDADNYCKSNHPTPVKAQEVVDNNGSLQWVLVYVKSGLPANASYPVPTDPVTLDQIGCMYTPHVFGVRAGQKVKIVNSDSTLHNIHPLPAVNAQFNIGMPIKGMTQEKVFDKPELPPFHIKCDVHKWMSSYCGVFSHPFFAVTDQDGNYKLSGLPAGTYVIEAWQEKYGPQDQTVTVSGTDTKTQDFSFKAS
ncbi:MAG TPA: carboxypeptidase regulatory-like domain-containing protein [Thermoanaerobaculia bacterium]|nr:carboxypeptidase regulatory-like domain-containing protein [Thermoanaerobaculia bacterium]